MSLSPTISNEPAPQDRKKLFTSFGSILIKVIEVADCLDALFTDKAAQKKNTTSYNMYVKMVIAKEDGGDLVHSFSTANYPYTSGTLDSCSEEYLFEGVSSAYNIIASLHAANSTFESKCIGVVVIPISRLEENITSVQWYQLNNFEVMDRSSKGLRSAIKMELMFRQTGMSMRKPTPREELLSTYGGFNNKHPSVEPSESSRSPDVRDSPLSTEGALGSPTTGSVVEPNPSVTAAKSTGGDDRLPVGIVEYIAIIGPSSMPPLKLAEMQDRALVTAISVLPPMDEYILGSPEHDGDNADANSSNRSCDDDFEYLGDADDQDKTMDVQIYDRFPRLDYPKSPLPSKVEWFAFPEGSVSLFGDERPEPKLSSFVMSGSGGSDELFGACLTFFVRSSYSHLVNLHSSTMPAPDDASSGDDSSGHRQIHSFEHDWWENTNSSDALNDKVVWSGIGICLLTRGPFIEQLCRSLLYVYMTEIVDALSDWETQVAVKMRLGGGGNVKPFVIGGSNLFVQLCIECPLPVPGLYSIRVKMPPLPEHKSVGSKGVVSIYPDTAPSHSFVEDVNREGILFQVSMTEQLRDCQYDTTLFFEYLGPRVALDCIGFALSECKMLFHSTDLSKLPIICESIRALIYPFKWSHVFVPVVPAVLLDLVQAPVPFILGMHSSKIKFIQYDFLKDVIIINCDTARIDHSRVSVVQPSFPPEVDRWLMVASKMIMLPSSKRDDSQSARNSEQSFPEDSSDITRKISKSRQIQILLFDVMVAFLRHIPSCLFFVNRKTPVFNRPLFLSKFVSSDASSFLEVLTNSNSFHQFIASINTPDFSLFVKCSELDPIFFSEVAGEVIPSSDSPPMTRGSLAKELSTPPLLTKSLSAATTPARRLSSTNLRMRVANVVMPDWIVNENSNQEYSALEHCLVRRLALYSALNDGFLKSDVASGMTNSNVPCCVVSVNPSQGTLASVSPPNELSPLLSSGRRRSSTTSKVTRSNSQFGMHDSIQRRESIELIRKTSRKLSAAEGGLVKKDSYNQAISTSNESGGSRQDDETETGTAFDASSPGNLPVPTVLLDSVELIAATHDQKTWTAADVSVHIGVDEARITKFLNKAVSTRHSLSTTTNISAFNLGLDHSNSLMDERIVFFLQLAFSADSSLETDFDSTLFSCSNALINITQREALVEILSQSETSVDYNKMNKNAWRLLPVHQRVFDALYSLSTIFLQCCASQDDFVSAYKLLQVGGKYCSLDFGGNGRDSTASNVAEYDQEENTQFLSDLLRHHLIYQNTALWAAVMRSRLSANDSPAAEVLMAEVHSLLHEMQRVGVNFDRALLFIQLIADDYRMDVEKYFDLQRFMAEIWILEDDSASDGGFPGIARTAHSLNPRSMSQDSYVAEVVQAVTYDTADEGPSVNTRRRSSFFRHRDKGLVGQEDSIAGESSELQLPTHIAPERAPAKRRSSFVVSPLSLDDDLVAPLPSGLSDVADANSSLLDTGRHARMAQVFGREKSNSSNSTASIPTSRPQSGSLSAVSPAEMEAAASIERSINENFKVDQREYDIEMTYENSSDLQQLSSTPSYFSTIFSSFNPPMTPPVTKRLPIVRQATASNILRNVSSDSAEGSSGQLSTHAKASSEIYEEILILDKTGKARHGDDVTSMHTSGKWLVVGTVSGLVELVNMQLGRQIACVSHKEPIVAVRCLERASGFVSACRGGIVKVWKMPKLSNGEHVESPDARYPEARISSWTSKWIPFGTSAQNPPARVVNPKDKRIAVIKGHSNPISAMTSEGGFHEEESVWQIATGDITGEVSVYRGTTKGLQFNSAEMRKEGKNKRAKLSGLGSISQLVMVKSSKLSKQKRPDSSNSASDVVAVGTSHGAFALLDVNTGHWTFRQPEAHRSKITCIEPLNGTELFTASNDRTVKLWDIRQRICAAILGGSDIPSAKPNRSDSLDISAAGPITALATGGWNRDFIVTASADCIVRIWDIRYDTSQPCLILKGHTDRVTSVIWENDGILRTSSYDGTVMIWDSITGNCCQVLRAHYKSGISSMSHSVDFEAAEDKNVPQKSWLVVGVNDGTIKMWKKTYL